MNKEELRKALEDLRARRARDHRMQVRYNEIARAVELYSDFKKVFTN